MKDNENTKKWYQSKTVINGILTVVTGILSSIFKVDIDVDAVDQITEIALQAGNIVFAGMTIWSRIKATKKIA